MANITNRYTLLDAATTVNANMLVPAADFRHATFAIDTASSANFTIKIVGSIQKTKPDITASQSPSNSYSFIKSKDLEDGTAYNGDDGIVGTGTDINGAVNAEYNGLEWIGVILTARSAGAITVNVELFNNV